MIEMLDTQAEEGARIMIKRDICGFLNHNYPVISWGCRVSLTNEMGSAIIVAEDISMDHGMFMHIPPTVAEMEKCLRFIAEEIMERFGIHTHQDLLDLPRRINGEALNASKGER